MPAILDFCGVDYKEQGKNISPGWVGVPCPFCSGKGHHLGINTTGYGFFCWQCGEKGFITKFVAQVLGVSTSEAWSVMRRFLLDGEVQPNLKTDIPVQTLVLPLRATKWTAPALRFIKRRKFKSKPLEREFQVYPCIEPGNFKNRLIIPIYYNRRLVTFTGRDFTGKSEAKYYNCPKDKSILPVRSTLYGIDDADKNTAILVEGPTDRWRLGKQSMALMGKTISDSQVHQLFLKNFREVFIVLDANEDESAQKIADRIRAFVKEVHIVSLEEGDPGDLSNDEASYLMKELIYRNTFI